MESFGYQATRRALARALRSTKKFDRKLSGPASGKQGGAAPPPPGAAALRITAEIV